YAAHSCLVMGLQPPRSTLLPYTTLFRSIDRAGGERRAPERREHRRQALAIGLVTGRAIGLVDLLTAFDQLLARPFLAGQLLELGRLGLAFGHPGGVVLGRLGLDHHRHEGVVLAAQLGALAAV